MTDRKRVAVRGALALLLGALAWGVTRSYVQLTDWEALLVAGLTSSAALCYPRAGAWRIVTALLLALTLLGFWYILRNRMADRNLVLVGLLVALTGLLSDGRKQ